MKHAYLKGLMVLFSFQFLFTACFYDKSKEKPFAMGETDQLVVIVDDEFKRTEFSDSIWWYLTPPVAGLPQPEDKIKVSIKSFSQLNAADDLITRYRNLMFVVLTSSPSKLASVAMDTKDSTFLKSSPNFFSVQRDVYAVNQQLFIAKAKDEQDFINQLKLNRDAIIERVQKFDEVRYARALTTEGINKETTHVLDSVLNLEWQIPLAFQPLVEGDHTIAFGRTQTFSNNQDQVERITNQRIIVSRIPVTDERARQILNEKDSVGRITGIYSELRAINTDYAQGEDDYSYVEEDLRSYWTSEVVQIAGRSMYLNRNLWKIQNPVMGGPMLVYFTYLPESKEMFIAQAIIYGAGAKKSTLVREMEAVVGQLSAIHEISNLKM